ncbi:LysM domain containing protein [Naviculisporaceae sp. PSN 640]
MRSHKFITGLVIAGTTAGVLGQTAPPASTQPNTISTCNQWHVVGSGTTCEDIETAHGITHAQFLAWNPDVSNDCITNFWGGFAYCVGAPPASIQPNTIATCNLWHVVASGDDCLDIETEYGITRSQFLVWNPDVSNDCVTNFWGGYAYCVGAPPAPTQQNTAANCRQWHVVEPSDTCPTVETASGISHSQFLAWNPSVSNDCSLNFWAAYAYCVGTSAATASSSTSAASSTITSPPGSPSQSGSSGWISSGASTTTSMPPYSIRHPITSHNITTPTIDTAYPPTKTQPGQPSYCNEWHLVMPGETCEKIAAQYPEWMSFLDLHAWNPALGVDCSGLYVYYWLCVGIQPQTSFTVNWPTNATLVLPPMDTFTPPPTPTDIFKPWTPTPTQAALPTDCMAWYQARPNQNCTGILEEYEDLTEAQFMSWHPFLSGDCNGLWANNYYCVWAGPTPPPELSTNPNAPTLTSTTTWDGTFPTIVSGCTRLGKANENDTTCAIFADRYRIPVENLLLWNPAYISGSSTCDTDIQNAPVLCVEGPGGVTTTFSPSNIPSSAEPPSSIPFSSASASSSASSTTSSSPIGTPAPVQPNMTTSCRRFYKVQADDGCWAIANSARIDLNTEFYVWNPDVGACENLWLDYYVCIGVSGPVTTITAGPPVPT